jgi:hypothetical protein
MPQRHQGFSRAVFVNCPFDEEYKPLFSALVFTILIAGFEPRCALEADNSGEPRVEKILRIISECQFAIHDISRTELNAAQLPRFNMPLELGMDLGCRRLGKPKYRHKKLLVLDKEPYRYQQFISDISGQDIREHHCEARRIIRSVRHWLCSEAACQTIPSAPYIFEKYKSFQRALPELCQDLKKDPNDLPFNEFVHVVGIYLQETEE